MGNNLTINDKNIAKVITVLKYVNISFSETADSTKQIPGTSLEERMMIINFINFYMVGVI